MFYVELFAALQHEKVRYLVVGGLAVNLHGVQRLTMDVDLVLALDETNIGRFRRAAERLSLEPVQPVSIKDLGDPAKTASWISEKGMLALALRSPEKTAPTVDVLVKPAIGFEDAYARRVEMSVGELTVAVASIDDIIALKTGTGRLKDRADIEALGKIRE
jgi:hypothetical protein